VSRRWSENERRTGRGAGLRFAQVGPISNPLPVLSAATSAASLGSGSGLTRWRRLDEWQRAAVWDRLRFCEALARMGRGAMDL
jgi:hypothetical protein